jgi:3-(3-hydroxy-phenyl)propionate hydroxylase
VTRTVVIAGAGPTGLMLACELRLAGVPVVVVDPQGERPERSNGMAVHGRTLEIFRKRGLTERIREEDTFVWPRTPFAFLWLDLDTVGAEDLTTAYPQWRTERLLAERAAELGAEFRYECRVTGAEQDETGVTVTVESAGGADRLRAAYLVGCDGPGSTVRDLAGIRFDGDGPTYLGLLGDVAVPAGGELFEQDLGQAGLFGALPLEPGMIRLMTIEFGADPSGPEEPVTVEELLAAVKRVAGRDVEVGEARWLSRFGGPNRLAERYRAGRILVAGDAAHHLFISGTQGLNTGVHDAVNLGWKLAAEIDGTAPAGLLDTYEAERRPVGERMYLHAQASMALMHPLDRMEPVRAVLAELLRFDEVNRHLLGFTTSTRYPMPDGGGHPLTGLPLPDVPVTTDAGGTSTADLLRDGRGLLLDLSGGDLEIPGLDGWDGRVRVVTAAPAAELDAAALLVRPDGHVAHACEKADGAGLENALRRWFGDRRATERL